MSKFLIPATAAAALLVALSTAPEKVKEPVLDIIGNSISAQNVDRAILVLKGLLGYSIYKSVTGFLSELAQNDFRLSSEKSRYDWPKEVIVITGGTGGFGSLMAKDFVSRGIKVVLLDLRDDLPADLRLPNITYFKCDITDGAAVKEVADKIRKQLGDPSVLINNAGVSMGQRSILTITEKEVKTLYGVNICSHFNTVREFLPAMIKNKKGHVVTISSMAAFACTPGLVAYSSSKSAAQVFHEGLQSELRTFYNAPEVKCTVVHPTFADTPMVQEFKSTLEKTAASIISPKIISDAVVNQVLSCRGKQLILNGNLPYAVTTMRAWPHWLSGPIRIITNRAMSAAAVERATPN